MTRSLQAPLRRLRSYRWTAVVAVLALGLSAGTVGGALAFVDALERHTLDVPEPERLVAIAPTRGEALLGIPLGTLHALAEASPMFTGLCAWARGAAVVDVQGRGTRRSIEGLEPACVGILGVPMAHGRWFGAADVSLGDNAIGVAVVSDHFWRTALAADPHVLGRTLTVEGAPVMIVGVLPPGFRGLHVDQGPDVVVPHAQLGRTLGMPGPLPALYAVGRLAPGSTLAAATADVRARWPDIWARTAPPLPPGAPPSPAAQASALRIESAARGFSDLRQQHRQSARLLAALAGALLVLALLSVAGLFMAMAEVRANEFTVLGMLGATRGQVVARMAAEGTLLGLAAGVGAAVTAAALTRVVAASIWTAPVALTLQVTPTPWQFVGLVAGTCALTLVLLLPAARDAWCAASRGVGVSSRTMTPITRSVRLSVQTAGTLALVFAALAFGKNVRDIQAIDPGYRAERLVWSTLERQPDAAPGFDAASYADALRARVAQTPGVAAAALSASFPVAQVRLLSALTPAARPGADIEVPLAHARVSAGFIAALDAPIVEGRELREGAAAEVMLNCEAARLLFGAESALGQAITLRAGAPLTVVGVVADFSIGDLRLAGLPVALTDMTREPALLRTPILVMRVADGATIEAAALAEAVRAGGRHVLGPVRPVWPYLTGLLARERLVFGLAALLAVVAVLITGTALFATLTVEAARRQRELAIRMAMGASPVQATAAVCGPLARAVGAGLVAGLPVAWAVGRAAQALLHRTAAFDPWVMAATLLAVAVMTLLAAVGPARRIWRLPVARHLNAST